jgi:hypothetical protein
MAVFRVHADSVRQIIAALVNAYKTVAQETLTPPSAVTIAEAKSEVGLLIETQVRRIRGDMLAMAKQLNSGPALTGELGRLSGDLQSELLIQGNREIDIWSAIETRKSSVVAVERIAVRALSPENPVKDVSSTIGPTLRERFLQHPWVHGIATNAIGGMLSTALIGAFIYRYHVQQARVPDKPNQGPVSNSAPPSKTRPSIVRSHTLPASPSTIADSAAQTKAVEVAHLQAVQHIDRALEDGRAGLGGAQELFQQKFDDSIGAAVRRGLGQSTMEQSLLQIAMRDGQAKVDEVAIKTKRAIEDELIQYGVTIPTMSALPWLQSEVSGYAEFKKQSEAAKEGMAATIKNQIRQRGSQ